MEDRRSGGATAATRASRDANGTHLRDLQVQAFLGLNAERLNQLKGFVVDKGPELLGDLFCPWAKWTLILLTSLVQGDTDGSLQRFIARIFGKQGPHPIKSPLQIVVSSLRDASEEAFQNDKFMADLRTGAVPVCRAIILMLIMAVANLGWKGLVCFHLGFFVAHMNLPFSMEDHDLIFQAVHVFLHALDAVAPTSFCRFLLPVVGSVFVVSSQAWNGLTMNGLMFVTSAFVILFLTPFWFGVCLLFPFLVHIFATQDDQDLSILTCISYLVIRLVAYASGGGLCGALLVSLCPIVLHSCDQDPDGTILWTPLPLVLALMSCLFTSFWVGLCFTSMLVFTLAAANDNFKAIMWWFVSFAALHLLSYAFSRNSSVIIMCFIGSYFSYGCIL